MKEPEELFQPVSDFNFEVNRAERTQQVRYLVPLLTYAKGREWFLEELHCPCSADEARRARPYHLAFPLRDLFTTDFYHCSDNPELEISLIRYYNRLFGLPVDYGVDTIWRTHSGGPIRHPAAPGRSGWHRQFLSEYLSPDEVEPLMHIRGLLDTETDALLLLPQHVVTIECKYLSGLSSQQYDRQVEMGNLLAQRLGRDFFFGLVVQEERSVAHARIQEPYVTWERIRAWLSDNQQQQSVPEVSR